MSEIWWNVSGTDERCDSYGGGYWPVITVTATVDDDGVVLIEGDGLSLVSWNHRPALVRTALRCSGGIAQWKPRWQLLVVLTADLVDGGEERIQPRRPRRAEGMLGYPLYQP